ncbi:ABC transporter ATP-binding protein [Paenibacillus glycinis]|uniref:ATP-binding cassette domain-containing protein n=1 Tax=Paenibacillus glycinis TaxID=2697035 RepID=A0ABW9XX63_9BACL|nr:ABC transporter ATP-binding protein [Paenibacillus glycinis]NBD26879.1 ATP-binding cassette domain-containing protein [Paenibacillus glycinis]
MSRTAYEARGISQVYKKGKQRVRANDDISLTVGEGEILGVLGPNGAGKSTLIKQLVGQLKPTEGEVLFFGRDVLQQTRTVAEYVAYFSQEPHVLSVLRAHEALAFTGRLRGMDAREASRQAHELLARFGMADMENKFLKQLSGGQKRLVGIGTALIGNSPVLILDEPTNELDPKNRRLVWQMIQEHNRAGATVILVTHNVLEAEQVVDRVAVINHGRLLAIDSVAKLKRQVDQRLKFMITVEVGRREETETALRPWGIVQEAGENRLRVLVDKRNAGELLDFIIRHTELPIEEYAVTPPSLEDVYFHIDEASAVREAMNA